MIQSSILYNVLTHAHELRIEYFYRAWSYFILKIKITFSSFTNDYNKILLNTFVGT